MNIRHISFLMDVMGRSNIKSTPVKSRLMLAYIEKPDNYHYELTNGDLIIANNRDAFHWLLNAGIENLKIMYSARVNEERTLIHYRHKHITIYKAWDIAKCTEANGNMLGREAKSIVDKWKIDNAYINHPLLPISLFCTLL